MYIMEDQVVKPNHYAYSFRVDISIATGLTKVIEFLQKYNCKYYIVGAETSQAGKEHFQCILWFDQKIDTTKLRNWWKGKTSKTKQPVSLTSAKKIGNLAKYTMKDKNFTTNLTPGEVDSIGQWSLKLEKVQWADALEAYAKEYNAEIHGQDVVDQYGKKSHYDDNPSWSTHWVETRQFGSYLLEFYKIHNKRPSRATLMHLAWKHGHMSNTDLLNKWF